MFVRAAREMSAAENGSNAHAIIKASSLRHRHHLDLRLDVRLDLRLGTARSRGRPIAGPQGPHRFHRHYDRATAIETCKANGYAVLAIIVGSNCEVIVLVSGVN